LLWSPSVVDMRRTEPRSSSKLVLVLLLGAAAAQLAAAAAPLSWPSITADDLSIKGLGPALAADVAKHCGEWLQQAA
jgi:hypothetical protein